MREIVSNAGEEPSVVLNKVTDGKGNLMSLFGVQHGDAATVDVTVLNPTVERVIVSLPAGFTDAQIPRFAADGQSLLFSATPPDAAAGARREIYNVNVDGTGLTCLTCGLADPTPPAAGIGDVRVGRYVEIELAAKDKASAEAAVKQMCEKLLANTVIESYRVEIGN